MKRFFSLFLVMALVLSCAIPVSAANDSGWIELLESTSVLANGDNWFTISGTSGSLTLTLETEKRLRKIDVLLWHPSGQRPSSASVTAGGKTTTLEVLAIGGNLCRITGYVPDAFYESITVAFKKATSTVQTYEVLSFKVTPIGVQEFVADAEVYFDAWGVTDYFSTNYNIPFWYDEYGEVPVMYEWLARVHVYDWKKFDSLSIWGSATNASIESIRVSIGTTALDYEVNFIDVEHQDSQIYGDILLTPEVGKYLYNLTIDLSSTDRGSVDPLYVYFTGSFNSMVSAYFNCQYVNGSVVTADTTQATWKVWAKDVLASIKALPERIAEELGKLYKPDEGKIEQVQEQSQELAEDRLGAVYQAGQVVDGLVGAFQNQTAAEFLTVPTLTVPLGEVNWTIGGWTVQVVPDAFKPIVEVLKTVIDIVCTLAFLKSMRARFEKLLSGGNA